MDGIVEFFRTAPIPPEVFAPSLGLIILLPLLGAFVCGVFGKWLGRANVHLVACSAIAGAFVLSLMAFWATSDAAGGRVVSMPNPFGMDRDVVRYAIAHDYGTWFSAGDFRVNFGLLVDHLSGILLLVITGVGFLIHLYSTSYMEHDDGYWRYFAYLNLFVAAMLDAGDGRQPGPALRRLGGRGHGQLPADRLLVHGQREGVGGSQGVRRQPHR